MIRTRSLALVCGLASLTLTTAFAAHPPLPAAQPVAAPAMAAISNISDGDEALVTAVLCFAALHGNEPDLDRAISTTPLGFHAPRTTSSSLAEQIEGSALLPFGTIPASALPANLAPDAAATALVWLHSAERAAGPFDWRIGLLDPLRLLPATSTPHANDLEQTATALAASEAPTAGTRVTMTAGDGGASVVLWDFETVAPTPTTRAISLADGRECGAMARIDPRGW